MNDKSPQIENGHIDIANELAEALMRTNLTAYQSRILWAIWRKTYGWHKKEDRLPVSQIVQMTGIKHGHVSRTLKELEARNIIIRNRKVTSFNKMYEEWKDSGKGARPYRKLPNWVTVPNGVQDESVPNGVQGGTQRGTKTVPNQGDSKENSKETIKRKSKRNVPDSKKPNPARFEPDDMKLASLLSELMTENNPGRKQESETQLGKWADCCRLLREQDHRDVQGIENHIRFSQNHDFWKQNILSMDTLRRQFDKLTMKMKGGDNGYQKKFPNVFHNE